MYICEGVCEFVTAGMCVCVILHFTRELLKMRINENLLTYNPKHSTRMHTYIHEDAHREIGRKGTRKICRKKIVSLQIS